MCIRFVESEVTKVNGAVANSVDCRYYSVVKCTWMIAGMIVYHKHVKCFVSNHTLEFCLHTYVD